MELVLFRSCIPIPFLWFMMRGKSIALKPKNPLVMCLRVLLSLLSMLLTFWSLSQLPLADAVLIGRMQPMFVAIMAPFFLSEAVSALVWCVIAVSFFGVSLILQPSLNVGHLGGLAALCGAAINAGAHMAVRRLSAKEEPLAMVMILAIMTTLFVLPFVVMQTHHHLPSLRDGSLLCFLALVATCAQLLMTYAYKVAAAPIVSATTYMSVVFAVLWGYVFWGEIPQKHVWVGGGLVTCAGLSLLWVRQGSQHQYAEKS